MDERIQSLLGTLWGRAEHQMALRALWKGVTLGDWGKGCFGGSCTANTTVRCEERPLTRSATVAGLANMFSSMSLQAAHAAVDG